MAAETHWSMPWVERPAEEARIFNPAFCGELIGRTVYEYYRIRRAALNMATAFVILPLTLHKQTRDVLPGRANTAFVGWAAERSTLIAELPERARRLRPVTREALLFAVSHQLLGLEDGGFVPGAKPIRPSVRIATSTDEVNAARSAAGLLGRWFAAQGAQTVVLQSLGVAP